MEGEALTPQSWPHSSGVARPRLAAPAGACDCHIHIYDERFPVSGPAARLQTGARVAEYRAIQNRLGTTRAVVVAPAPYRFDNSATLDAVAQLGLAHARAVAVISPEVSDAELTALHQGGVRGIRFTLFDPATAVTRFDWIVPLSERVKELGWHVQLHLRGDQIVDHQALFGQIPGTMVFDHMARLPQPGALAHPAFTVLRRLIDKGRCWVKLSGAYLDSKIGPPSYGDATAIARAFIAAAPDRVVWGSDWPHPTERHTPDDAQLLDALCEWAPDDKQRQTILVENPAGLYDFPPPTNEMR